MPKLGRPANYAENRLNKQVKMAPASSRGVQNEKSKEDILNDVTGRGPRDVYGKAKNKMGKNEFLKLLTHQLQNQDPMKPMEQGKITAELAQFSQLEQLSNLNSKFDKMGENRKLEEKFYAASFVGKEVLTSGSSVSYKGKGQAEVLFNLPKSASKAIVRIVDQKGQLVSELPQESLGAGQHRLLWDGKRVDGRDLDEVRKISASAGILPKRVHGSALFQRGLTQVLSTTTLGTPSDAQEMDDLNPSTEKTYLHHYNFPPYSVGETRPMRTPGRREIGHGALAERAIIPVLPGKEKFPYVLRVVSEVLSSNGSTSMGSVCGSTLSLLDAGVPLKAPVSGTAMGLIKEGEEVRILTDIQGIEDFLGDMDFKVAGTEDGITSLQMDIKITGITFEIMEKALNQAKQGRIDILTEMNKAISKSNSEVSQYTPKMEKIEVDKKDIAAVIGKGGATIREIVEVSGAKVDINDEGVVTVSAPDEESRNKAMQMIKDITAKPEIGKIYSGKVVKIMDFGAFVNFLGKQDGLVHISQLAAKRVEKVSDVVKEGDEVNVKVVGFDRGKVKLSIKEALDS